MPKPPVPERFRALLESTNLGHLATIGDEGLPQVNPVWFLWDGVHILLSVKPETVKYRNLRRDPHLAISILDATNTGHYVELRGEVIEFKLYETLEFVNQLAHKYTGADFTNGHNGEERYRLTIQINFWTGQ